jgi:hypothetical protein
MTADRPERLPPTAGAALRLLASPLGALVARPWFDRAALWGLARWYFPLSHALAAATAADGSIEQWRTADISWCISL